jgi:CO dehydrogenase nickel-insertion accessory protein CooC1
MDFSHLSTEELSKRMMELSKKFNIAQRTNSGSTEQLQVVLNSLRFELQSRMSTKIAEDMYKKIPTVVDSDPDLNEKNYKPKPPKTDTEKKKEKITQNPFQKTSKPTSGEF